jgi:scyllo-inositol 2-dehydrogenase (NAD+)
MKSQINVGVVGLGRLGSLYVEYLNFQIPKANVIAVADAFSDRAAEIAKKNGVEHVFSDHNDMLELKGLDAVVIISPTSTHRDIVIDAASKGKMIFCEKPLSISLDDALAMKKAVEKNNVFFHMGFMRRFDRGYSAAMKRILAGEIGKPIVFKATSKDPFRPSLEYADPIKSGGLLLDMGIHDFDLARWFMGEVAEVYSVGNVLAYPEMKTIKDIDNAVVSLSFESGTIGVADMTRSGIYGYDIHTEIMGTEGAIQIGYLRETPITIMKKEGISHDTVPYFMERFEESYIIQLKDFIEKAHAGKEPSVTIEDGERALLVAHAATHSLHQKLPVVIDNEAMEFNLKTEIEDEKITG